MTSPFARQFALFLAGLEGRLGGAPSEELRLAALLAAELSARGHVCVELEGCAGRTVAEALGEQAEEGDHQALPGWSEWRQALLACRTVGRAGGPAAPLVLDGNGRLYLHRLFSDERLVATEVRRLAGSGLLSIVTGGPGTGKTTHAASLLGDFAARGTGSAALAAPTGKAAARLSAAVEKAIPGLGLSREEQERVPRRAQTLHRLLGWSPGRGRFLHGPGDPLPHRLVVVDEASMAPLPLVARLIEALPREGRLVLIGDRDQLSSVEAGAVLADLCEGVGEAVTVLTKSWRFDPVRGIGRTARAVNLGRAREALEQLRSDDGEAGWKEVGTGKELDQALAEGAEGFRPFCEAPTPEEALAALDRLRILTPVREGTWGVRALNRKVTAALAKKGLLDPSPAGDGEWHHRRPLLVTANDYGLGLFNGDLGVAWRDPDGEVRAWFSVEGGLRSFRPTQLPPHETAFAMTVHKSQGSEFAKVVLVLPDRDAPVLTRELVYTAITRATARAEVWGREGVFAAAVARRTTRASGLREALRS